VLVAPGLQPRCPAAGSSSNARRALGAPNPTGTRSGFLRGMPSKDPHPNSSTGRQVPHHFPDPPRRPRQIRGVRLHPQWPRQRHAWSRAAARPPIPLPCRCPAPCPRPGPGVDRCVREPVPIPTRDSGV